METNRLKQFCAVVETSNLRRAADLLGMSHSALSKSLKVLEEQLKLKLFVPQGRGLVVTDDGRRLFQRCPAFFAEEERLLGRSEGPPADLLRIGSFEVFTSYFMGRLLGDHLRGARVEVHELAPGRLEEALITEKVDVGITYEPIPHRGVDHVRVTQVEMGAYACPGAFDAVPLEGVPFVVPVVPLEGAPSGVRGSDGWPEQTFRRRVLHRVDLMTTGIELVHQRLCAIFIPRFVAVLHNEVVREELAMVELDSPFAAVKRSVYLMKRESTLESRLVKRVAAALRQVCSRSPA
jgi:DNA-binding transcriptional LysR family regulator